MFGMPLDLYWHGHPDYFFAYQEAYRLKQKEKFDMENQVAWLSGTYNLSALYEVMILVNRDPKTVPDSDLPKYFSKPIDFDNVSNNKKSESDIIKERNIKAENDVKVAIANSMIALNNKKIREKQLRGKEQNG